MADTDSAPMERAPHPWSDGFTWVDHPDEPSTLTREQVDQYDAVGFTVVQDAFDAATMERLDAEIEPSEHRVRELLGQMPDQRLSVAGYNSQTIAPHIVLQSDWVREFCAHPVLAGICRDLVGSAVRLYWDQAVYKHPHSADPVLWHQDNGYTYVVPQSYLTCWIAITDATLDNGCVWVMPGVHRDGTLRHRSTAIGQECWGDHDAAVAVPVRAGSIVVFTSLTPHYTGQNATDEIRKSYIAQYCADGAIAYLPDERGTRTGPFPQEDEGRQFRVV